MSRKRTLALYRNKDEKDKCLETETVVYLTIVFDESRRCVKGCPGNLKLSSDCSAIFREVPLRSSRLEVCSSNHPLTILVEEQQSVFTVLIKHTSQRFTYRIRWCTPVRAPGRLTDE